MHGTWLGVIIVGVLLFPFGWKVAHEHWFTSLQGKGSHPFDWGLRIVTSFFSGYGLIIAVIIEIIKRFVQIVQRSAL